MQAHIINQLIQHFDGLTPEEINVAQFDHAIRYLEYHYSEELATEVSKEPLFWKWWDRIFTMNNEQIIQTVKDHRKAVPVEFYHRLLRPKLYSYYMTDKIKGEIFNNIKIDTLCQTTA